jgi:hypothetical protein
LFQPLYEFAHTPVSGQPTLSRQSSIQFQQRTFDKFVRVDHHGVMGEHYGRSLRFPLRQAHAFWHGRNGFACLQKVENGVSMRPQIGE